MQNIHVKADIGGFAAYKTPPSDAEKPNGAVYGVKRVHILGGFSKGSAATRSRGFYAAWLEIG
jgi:hypothetical protein